MRNFKKCIGKIFDILFLEFPSKLETLCDIIYLINLLNLFEIILMMSLLIIFHAFKFKIIT